MRVRFWGVRGSMPVSGAEHSRYGGDTACVEVRAGGQIIVLDLGTGARLLGERLAGEVRPVTVLLSHAHWDHVCGLPFFAPLRRPDRPLTLASAVPGGTRRVVEDMLRPPFFPVGPEVAAPAAHCVDLPPSGSVALADGVRLSMAPTNHHGGSVAYRIDHGGCSFVYGGDHEIGNPAIDDGLVALMAGADLAVLDATAGAPHAAGAPGAGHSGWAEAIELARRAGVGRVLLTHHHPASDDAALDRLAAAARRRWSRAGLARRGRRVELSRHDVNEPEFQTHASIPSF